MSSNGFYSEYTSTNFPGVSSYVSEGSWSTTSGTSYASSEVSRNPSPEHATFPEGQGFPFNSPAVADIPPIFLSTMAEMLHHPFASTSSASDMFVPPPGTKTTTQQSHIPRPANAFIIFRSELIREVKRKLIPDTRQQHMSRLAGQCWNLMSEGEKRIWFKKAEQAAAQHRAKYPNWRYRPKRRQSSKQTRSTSPSLSEKDTSSDEYIRSLRETYTGKIGPIIPSSRRTKKEEAQRVRKERIAVRSPALPQYNQPAPDPMQFLARAPTPDPMQFHAPAPDPTLQQFGVAPAYSQPPMVPVQGLSTNTLGLTFANNSPPPVATGLVPVPPEYMVQQNLAHAGYANLNSFAGNNPTPPVASFDYIPQPLPVDVSYNQAPAEFPVEMNFEAFSGEAFNVGTSTAAGMFQDPLEELLAPDTVFSDLDNSDSFISLLTDPLF